MASKTNEQKAESVLLKSDVSKDTWSLKLAGGRNYNLESGILDYLTKHPQYSDLILC